MEFDGTFRLDGVTVEEVWLALSDPVVIANALPGCQFLVHASEDSPDFDELEAQVTDDDPPVLPEADPEIINPVAQRVVNRFFGRIEDQLTEVSRDGSNLHNRIRGLL